MMKKKTRLFKYFLTIVKIAVLGLPLFAVGYNLLSNVISQYSYALSVSGATAPADIFYHFQYGLNNVDNACFFTLKKLGLLYSDYSNSDFNSYIAEFYGLESSPAFNWSSLVSSDGATLSDLTTSSGLINEDFLSWTGVDFSIGYTSGAEFLFLNYYINYLINFSIILFIPEVILYFFDFASGLCSKFVDRAVEGD